MSWVEKIKKSISGETSIRHQRVAVVCVIGIGNLYCPEKDKTNIRYFVIIA